MAGGRLRTSWLAGESEFTSLYREHGEALLGFFAARVFDGQAALDLTAETFAQAFAGRHRFRGSSAAQAQAWLFAIASHQLARYLRRGYANRRLIQRLRIQVPMIGDESERIMELDAVRQMRPVIANQLATLSDEQRAAVQLRVVDELPFSVVAARLGISEPAARMRVSRALSALARALTGSKITSEEPA